MFVSIDTFNVIYQGCYLYKYFIIIWKRLHYLNKTSQLKLEDDERFNNFQSLNTGRKSCTQQHLQYFPHVLVHVHITLSVVIKKGNTGCKRS